MANYAVDPELLRPRVPAGTELDLQDGKCFVSLVGFMFLDTRVLGIPVPMHVNFEEVNLRFYIKREAEGETRGAEKRGATAREAPAREATKREASAREDRDGERRPSREAPTRTASRDDAPKSTQESYAEDRRAFALLKLAIQGERDIAEGRGLSLAAHREAMQARLRAGR